jgi:hypothetical protein
MMSWFSFKRSAGSAFSYSSSVFCPHFRVVIVQRNKSISNSFVEKEPKNDLKKNKRVNQKICAAMKNLGSLQKQKNDNQRKH